MSSETVHLIGDPKSTICCLKQIKCLTCHQTRAFKPLSALSLQLLTATLQTNGTILQLQALNWCECSEANGNSQITARLLRSSAKEA